MGNSASSNNTNRPRISANSLVGGGGGSSKNALGLSKQELDERCRPSGLYKTCQWDDKVLRRMIGDGKLASRKSHVAAPWECPICFCNYDEVNRTTCCEEEICTECYLQLKPQKNSNDASCPYCVSHRFKVGRCLEAAPPKPVEAFATQSKDSVSLVVGDQQQQHPSTPPSSSTTRSAYCLTPEQRQTLEAKVAEQQIHPLAARLAQEEAERRLANELQYLSNNIHHPIMMVQNQQLPSSASRQRQGQSSSSSLLARSPFLLTEEQQLAMAIEASLRTGS